MALNYKKNETRGWATSYRGDLAIHASKHIEKSVLHLPAFQEVLSRYGIEYIQSQAGKVLCVVRLKSCVPTWKVRPFLSPEELAFGDYSEGRFAWITDNLRSVVPFPFKGSQGFFNVPEHLFKYMR